MTPRSVFTLVVLSLGAAMAATPVPKAYRDYAARRDGRVERGREIFFSSEKAACGQCHAIDGSGAKAGPDLFAVADKFPRRELIDAILEPNATIAVGYETTLVETRGGESFLGVIKTANDEAVELMAADGVRRRIATRWELWTRQGRVLVQAVGAGVAKA